MIPEIRALEDRPGVIRIPNQIDVPVTKRILKLIDTPPFQRLSRISQLGLVSRVYPGATHTRFEHSLGVYRNALMFVRRLLQFEYFRTEVTDEQLEALVVAALLHDVGHWPYCHPVEDMGLEGIPSHEAVAAKIIQDGEIRKCLAADWNVDWRQVIRLIDGSVESPIERLLYSLVSGPIDIDKMDYLYRDSLHCGVPYGMNFDSSRLINSICLNRNNDGIAISSKGKTAAEMMIFARYVMFSEVYWHHSVRSATAMVQRIWFLWYQQNARQLDIDQLRHLDDRTLPERLLELNRESGCRELISAIFGQSQSRTLHKRLLSYNANQNPRIYEAVAHRPYQWLAETGDRLAQMLGSATGENIDANELLIDAPPAGLEVQFKVEVSDGKRFSSLDEASPVVKALVDRQFDDFVKRVRVFVHPRLVSGLDPGMAENCLLELLNSE